jgi:hypothetical protein
MTSLQDLLDEAAGTPRPFDAYADLRRAHRTAVRRRNLWAGGVAGSVIAVGALGYAVLPDGGDRADTLQPADGGPSGAAGSDLVQLRYYDVPTPPSGWHVVGDRPQYAMLTRDGSGATTIDSGFVGQIVVMLSPGDKAYDVIYQQPTHEYDGRIFYLNGQDGGQGTNVVSVRTADGTWLQLEYPAADFSLDAMVTYLDGVVVKAGAVPGDQTTGHVAFHVIHRDGGLYYIGGKAKPGTRAGSSRHGR